MARFNTKQDLNDAIVDGYNKLTQTINNLSSAKQEAEFTFDVSNETADHYFRDKNIRDCLIHLYEWQLLLIDWVRSNEKEVFKPFLPSQYNWKTYGEMNREIWKKHQSTSLTDAKALLNFTHQEALSLLDQLTEEKLFSRNTYAKGSTIAQYFTSATVSHYDWALKKIKKHIKSK